MVKPNAAVLVSTSTLTVQTVANAEQLAQAVSHAALVCAFVPPVSPIVAEHARTSKPIDCTVVPVAKLVNPANFVRTEPASCRVLPHSRRIVRALV